MKLKSIILSTLLLVNVACSQNFQLTENNLQSYSKSINTIVGKADFPSPKFKTKADIEDIAPNATISLIYTPDYSNSELRNVTVATGLTDNEGSFRVTPSSSFIPSVGDIFILEASKRIGGVGNNIITIRTYIKRTNTGWDSITQGNIYINSKTTSYSIIADNNTSTISANDTISKVSSEGTVSSIGSISVNTVNDLVNKVNTVLSENRDPFLNIRLSGVDYIISRDAQIGTLLQTGACVNCNFQGIDLSSIDLSDKDLTGADLSGQNLSSKDLSDTNLTNAIMINTNLESSDLTNTILTGADFTDAYLVNADLNGLDLTNTQFVYSFLSGANLNNAIFSNTSFTNADLRNAVWNNGDTCDSTSFGQCN